MYIISEFNIIILVYDTQPCQSPNRYFSHLLRTSIALNQMVVESEISRARRGRLKFRVARNTRHITTIILMMKL